MSVFSANARRGSLFPAAVTVVALGLLALSVMSGASPSQAATIFAVTTLAALGYRALLTWDRLLALLVLVVLFIPMQRYVLPGSLPFELEPYRLLVGVIFAGWVASLLVDRRVSLRASGFDAPILLLGIGVVGSVLANGSRVAEFEADVAKGVTFLISFILVFYLIVSIVRSRAQLDLLLKMLVGGGAVVAGLAIVESRTGYNVFNQLSRVVPLLEPATFSLDPDAERGLRAYASAQHPIALGAVLVMLIPPAIYLVQRFAQRRWWIAAGVLGLGALATISRTSVLMLVAIALVFLWLRPTQTKRLWPLLIPAVVAVHFALPGTLGTLKQSFFPAGGLIAEQSSNPGSRGQGRVADLGPSLEEFARKPLFGQGYATRRVEFGRQNAQILDDQWLGNLLEVGLAGALGWAWLFTRSIRRLARQAKRDHSAEGWLYVALAASITTCAIGMFTYDAFAFIQVTLVLFILLGVAAAALSPELSPRRAREPRPQASSPL